VPGEVEGSVGADAPGTREGEGKVCAAEQQRELDAAVGGEEALVHVRCDKRGEHVEGQRRADERRGQADDQQQPAGVSVRASRA
jgi:hypothetical protein